MSDWVNKLGELLDEAGMEVTLTGWKAELEATEKKLDEAVAELEAVHTHLSNRHKKDALMLESIDLAIKKLKRKKASGKDPTKRNCTGDCMTCKGRCAGNAAYDD